jgi:N-formylglutamate deformylase
MSVHDFHAGEIPLLVSFPHVGTALPQDLASRLTAAARLRPDTDWHLPVLYDFVRAMGASTLIARYSRYLVDLNRPPEDTNLYPGQDTTGLFPVDTFRKEPVYLPGMAPTAAEKAQRLAHYWEPYHRALADEIGRLQARHGYALLWDAHSIASELPRFFDGRLPDLNLGTADGQACAPSAADAVVAVAAGQTDFTWVLNGRFKGGYITRRYGRPDAHVHAIQLEQGWASYLQPTHPYALRDDLAARVRPVLMAMIEAFVEWGRRHYGR